MLEQLFSFRRFPVLSPIAGVFFFAMSFASFAQIEVESPAMITGLDKPVAFISPYDGTGRMFIVERCGANGADEVGRIRVWNGTSVLAMPFLTIDIACSTSASNEQGLLGLAFHPDYETNGRFFVNYTDFQDGVECADSGDRVTRIAEYGVANPNDNVAVATESAVLSYCQPFSNHNGGQIVFGPDGYLYIFAGDGGSANDPDENGEEPRTLLGSILRIDVDGASPDYDIPASNPFSANARCPIEGLGAANCSEVWAFGLRNPWRNSFDRLTGELFVADVGQLVWEEVTRQDAASPGGEDYGWDFCEGLNVFEGAGVDCDGGTETGTATSPPFVEYAHESGRCSITGGYVYRGHGSSVLQGRYLFGDYCSGEIWDVDPQTPVAGLSWDAPGSPAPPALLNIGFGLSSFAEGEQGQLYVVNISANSISRIIDTDAMFVHGFEFGLEAWSSVSP